MSAAKFARLLVGLCVGAILATPMITAAQTEAVQVSLEGSGAAGTDPETGQPLPALVNPCTNELVDLVGTLTATSTVSTTPSGGQKTTISVVTDGVGVGETSHLLYSFSENQQLSSKLSGQEFEMDLTVKLSMKGAQSLDNWSSRLKLHLSINANGIVTSAHTRVDADKCNG